MYFDAKENFLDIQTKQFFLAVRKSFLLQKKSLSSKKSCFLSLLRKIFLASVTISVSGGTKEASSTTQHAEKIASENCSSIKKSFINGEK